eukprot:4097053-Prymnesium_polylepis.1
MGDVACERGTRVCVSGGGPRGGERATCARRSVPAPQMTRGRGSDGESPRSSSSVTRFSWSTGSETCAAGTAAASSHTGMRHRRRCGCAGANRPFQGAGATGSTGCQGAAGGGCKRVRVSRVRGCTTVEPTASAATAVRVAAGAYRRPTTCARGGGHALARPSRRGVNAARTPVKRHNMRRE